jgi:UDP-2,4-diacetamido-2,4,6-trideoxy-beta-L-altropyranose hydrolase
LFDWANDPLVRRMSFAREPIGLAVHEPWLTARLADPDCRLFLVLDERKTPMGLVRFTHEGKGRWALGVTLAPKRRGRGLAASVIARGCEGLRAEQGKVVIGARTRVENTAFRRAAQKVGFVEKGKVKVKGQAAVEMELHWAK